MLKTLCSLLFFYVNKWVHNVLPLHLSLRMSKGDIINWLEKRRKLRKKSELSYFLACNGSKFFMNNIQFKFKLPSSESIRQDLDIIHTLGVAYVTKSGNKLIIRTEFATYTVFTSGYVGVCGVRSETELYHSVKDFFELCEVSADYNEVISTIKINNICFHGRLNKKNFKANFIDTLSSVAFENNFKICMNVKRFSGINMSTPFANLTCFDSGAINVTGVASLDIFEREVLPVINNLINYVC